MINVKSDNIAIDARVGRRRGPVDAGPHQNRFTTLYMIKTGKMRTFPRCVEPEGVDVKIVPVIVKSLYVMEGGVGTPYSKYVKRSVWTKSDTLGNSD